VSFVKVAVAGTAVGVSLLGGVAAADEPVKLDGVQVIGVTPTDTTGVALDRYPANAQLITSEQLEQTQAQSLNEYLGRRGGSVFLSEAQSNPYQPDLFYRGYSISPLLGLPQGLALYVDGVRVNEVFGDVVNWDLIPDSAIDSLQLIPGSNPVFGQNTLAGALSLRTKSGFDAPGSRLELSGGSYGRYGVSAEQGFAGDHLAFFVSGEYDHEDGFRRFSPSRVGRLFSKGSYRDSANTVDLSVSLANNDLTGNGAAPRGLLLQEGRRAVFTYPDQTAPNLGFINLQANHIFSPALQLAGGVHFRRVFSKTLNGDGTEFFSCEDAANRDAGGNPFLCAGEAEGERVITNRDGNAVVASDANSSGTLNRSSTDQYSYGFNTQLTLTDPHQRRNRIAVGGSVDLGRARFKSETELAALTDLRGVTASGEFDSDGDTALRTRKNTYASFALANWAPLQPLDLTAAVGFTRTEVHLRDLGPSDDLNGDHSFTRFNPSFGATWHFSKPLSAFASYSESARAPTPVELTCADPEDPCRLPNSFVSDPPLKQVITRTVEAGLRYTGPALRAAAAFFNSNNSNDIIFITDGALTTEGYFSNVGHTVRRGFEAGGNYKLTQQWSVGFQYTYLDALFKESFLVNSPNHPLRDPADPEQSAPEARQVNSGNRIPLIPRHLAKANVEWRIPTVGIGLEVQGRSNSRFRGDEANVDPETLPGYAIFSLYGDWKPHPGVVLFARITNLFDRDTETFGVYGDAAGVLGDEFENDRRFVGPGAPRELSAGVRFQF